MSYLNHLLERLRSILNLNSISALKTCFDGRDTSDEEAWVQENCRKNEILKKKRIECGLEDALSLNHHEISCLEKVIDRMMSLKRNRVGYLVSR